MSGSFATNVNRVKERLNSGFGTGVMWGGWIHSMGWGVSTYIFPWDGHMTPKKREKEGEKMLGYGLSSLNENHMQEREKKRRRGGGDSV